MSTITPTVAVVPTRSQVNEGDTATFIVRTTNIASGTLLSYSVEDASLLDVEEGALKGSVQIGNNGEGFISIRIAKDALTEGTETIKLAVKGATAAIQIEDTSRAIQAETPYAKFIGAETIDFDRSYDSSLVQGLRFSNGSTGAAYFNWVSSARLNISELQQIENMEPLEFSINPKLLNTGNYGAFEASDGSIYVVLFVDPSRRLDGDTLDGLTYNVWKIIPKYSIVVAGEMSIKSNSVHSSTN